MTSGLWESASVTGWAKAMSKAPPEVQAIVDCGYAIWSDSAGIDAATRDRFDDKHIPVAGVRQVRVWGIQVDDERELPGHERTQIPDEELWEVNLVGKNGSRYEMSSSLLKPAPKD